MSAEHRTRGRDLNHVAWLYDPVIEGLSFGRERKFREKTIDYMEFSSADRILDVGCGTGSLTLLVAPQLSSPGEAVGVDAAPRMIKIAQRKAARSGCPARFSVGVAERLEYEDASFDLVVNSMFTHHIDRQLKRQAFAEMARVLKPGGRLVTADVDKPTTLSGWLMGWGARWLLIQKELVDNLQGDLPDMMAEAGFEQIERRDHLYGLVSFFTARKPEAVS